MIDPDFDFPPEMSDVEWAICDLESERDALLTRLRYADMSYHPLTHDAAKEIERLSRVYEDARSLIDGCYEVVELFDAKTPSQVEWKRRWLEAARLHGASSF